MATLNVCSRLSSKVDRFQVSVPGLDDPVQTLASEIKKHTDQSSSATEFDIIYAGQVLDQCNKLSSYNVQHQSTIYVVPKFSGRKESQEGDGAVASASSTANKHEVTMAIQSALLNLEYRNIVERMLNDPETVENIIAATPGLDKDPSVLAMLQEPELLAVLAHPNNMDSLLQLHPSFAQAAVTVATAVNEEGAKMGLKGGEGSMSYSLDQMSDDEDDMPQPSRLRAHAAGQNITASQLAAALQAATSSGGAGGTHTSPVSVLPSTSQGAAGASSSGTITSDFFQQAMAHAQTASSDAALQQLRDMGITDENVARQALAATGGDIQAAIDLIFGDGFM